MAKYYGTVRGNRGEATKCGSAESGIRAAAQSYDGSVIIRIWDGGDGKDRIDLSIGEGSTTYGRTYFCGTLEELKAKLSA